MSTKISSWVLALALCFCFFSSSAHANYNNYDWGNDVTYYKDDILSNYYTGASLDNWQWFPGSGEGDGDYTNDSFCQIYSYENQTILVYGVNGQQSCSWWDTNVYPNTTLKYVDYFSELGTVKMDCSNPLNDASCPGYQQAYFQMLCTTNPLYDASCPGYATAYALLMNEERMAAAATVVDDGVPANDGSDLTAYTEPVVEQTQQEAEQVIEDFSGSNTEAVQEVADRVQEAVEVVAGDVAAQELNAIAEQEATGVALSDEKIVEQSAASAEPSKEEGTSARDTIARLSGLGVLNNSQTNGVGDATGLSSSIEGTGGTISSTGQVQDSSASNGAGGGTNDGSSPQDSDGSNSGFGSVTASSEALVNGSTQLETDMGSNLNPLFSDPAISTDSDLMADVQEEKMDTLASQLLRNRINALIEVDTNDSIKDAEELVADSIQESIDQKLNDLTTDANQNQAEIVTLMGINIQFDSYNNKRIEDIAFYSDDVWFKEVEIPQNRRALRNGLAQQLLHNKMVDSQYERNGSNE